MKDKTSTISLIVGLAIPVVMVILIALAVLIPGRNINPTTDFIYATGSYPSYTTRDENTVIQHDLTIKNGILVDATQSYPVANNYPPYFHEKESVPRLFIHNTTENSNKEISLEEAKTLRLSAESKSPDGFTVSFGRRSYGVFPFFFDSGSDDSEHAYLSNQTASKEITLTSGAPKDIYSFQLVGWIIEEK
ncbi:MAG: hypothetical protein O3A36_00450 [bacterium]|nr:hypothetical protein [bacterium]